MKRILIAVFALFAAVSCTKSLNGTLKEGEEFSFPGKVGDFTLTGKIKTSENGAGYISICQDGEKSGYDILIKNGPIDGTRKTGSLSHVRNLYRSLAKDGEWADIYIAVSGKTVKIAVDGKDVVLYTEPEKPWRAEGNEGQRIGEGVVSVHCTEGSLDIADMTLVRESSIEASDPADEQQDRIIRLQQKDFPVIDYHVHLKGGLTKEMAHDMSMRYGINYGVAPNAGEGGVGRMLADDNEVYEYYNEIKDEPFLFGVQGEGRRWTSVFSQEALGIFEYLFTDAMTIVDHKGRISRIYRPEEVIMDEIGPQRYMNHLVKQIELILTNEPADIYANATFIPDFMQDRYAELWTDERIDRVLNVLSKYGIALEINPRYKIPSFDIIRKAKARGIKFTFGTNNTDADFGKLEYCIETIDSCGLTADDIWFPSYSTRRDRPTVIYNHFD